MTGRRDEIPIEREAQSDAKRRFTPRRWLVPIIIAAALVALLLGRWWAVGTADRLWAESLGVAETHGSIARLRTLLFLAALISAAVWCMGNLFVVHRSIGSVHIPRRLGNIEITEAIPRHYVSIGLGIFGLILAFAMSFEAWGWWYPRALAKAGTSLGLSDPVLQRDASYYLFALPWKRIIHGYATLLAAIMFGVSLILYMAVGAVRGVKRGVQVTDGARRHLGALLAIFALALVWGYRLEPAEYLAGVHNVPYDSVLIDVRLPTARLLGAVGLMTCAGSLLWIRYARMSVIAFSWGALGVLSFVGHYLVPAVAAGVRTDEELRSEILTAAAADFMRYAYGVAPTAETRSPLPRPTVPPRLAPSDVDAPMLWDEFAVNLLLNRLEREKPYLDFGAASVGRYRVSDGRDVPVIIGVREVNLNKARGVDPAFSWERIHLEPYRSAKGVVAVRADLVSDRGSPLFVPDLSRPGSVVPNAVDVALHDSLLLFGATTEEFAVVPEGLAHGVSLGGFPRRVALAWKLQSSQLVTSPAVSRTSVVLWDRSVGDRLEAVAPFADFGAAHPAVVDGRLFWTAFGYVASNTFPLVPRVEWRGTAVGYLRAGLVGVVEAATGETTVYLLPNADPLSRAWAGIAPDVVVSWSELPEALRRHLRYPEGLFRNQLRLLRAPTTSRRPGFFGRLRPPVGSGGLGIEPFWWLGPAPGDSTTRLRLQATLQTGEPLRLTGLMEGTVTDQGLVVTVQRFDRSWNFPGPDQTVGRFVARRGVDVGVAGPLKTVRVAGGMLSVQTAYDNLDDPDKAPELVSVAVEWAGAVGEGPTFGDALQAALLTDQSAVTVSSDWAAARRWFERLDEARQSGDWSAFGLAYGELRRLLTGARQPDR